MKTHILRLKNLVFCGIILVFVFLTLGMANAQSSPEFLVSWRAQNYAPAWYGGKVLPIVGTPINVGFELINAGKIVNLSQNTVRWYINDELVKNESDGLGIKSLKTITSDDDNNEMRVRITIIDYAADILDKIVIIPVVKPEAVIDSPYLNNRIGTGSSVFKLIPFFFNVSSLNSLAAEWLANNISSRSSADSLWQLDLNVSSQTPSGFKINLGGTIENASRRLESATRTIMLQKK